jgi:hypothetical protein
VVDILRGVVGAAGNYVLGWVMPVALALLAFVFLVLRPAGIVLDQGLLTGEGALALVTVAFAVLAAGLVLSALAGQLYRILEGYSWPRSWQARGRARESERKASLQRRVEHAESALDRALAAEQYDRFPVDDGQIAPTAFGNAMRAFETFGVDRYRLDSQAFWVELTTVAPDHLRAEIGRARASVDFFVAQVFLAAGFGVAAIVVWLTRPDAWPAVVAGIVALLAVPVFYRGAVASTTYWHSTVRALVHLGRHDLAARLGLEVPQSLADERLMWERLAAFDFYPFDDSWATLLDEFRVDPTDGAPDPDQGPDQTG